MNGLYTFKPWYATRLTGVRDLLVRRRIPPHAVTLLGVAFGGTAGLVLWWRSPGPVCGAAVAMLLVARLACANLDGGVARAAGRATRFGAVVNELGDRLAEFATLVGVAALAPPMYVAVTALAGTLPSWVALAGSAAGSRRVAGGPVGKTERWPRYPPPGAQWSRPPPTTGSPAGGGAWPGGGWLARFRYAVTGAVVPT